LLLFCCCWAPPGELSQQYLAAHIGLSPSQASGVFESLRARGFLSSEPGAHDRRRQAWRITAAGQQKVSRIEERLAPFLVHLQSSMSCLDPKIILNLFQRLASSTTHHSSVREAA